MNSFWQHSPSIHSAVILQSSPTKCQELFYDSYETGDKIHIYLPKQNLILYLKKVLTVWKQWLELLWNKEQIHYNFK